MPPLRFTMLWRQSDWGFFGRRNEVFARELAGRHNVSNVLHVEFVALPELARYAMKWVQAGSATERQAYATQLIKSLPGCRPIRVSEQLDVASIAVVLKRDAHHPAIARINKWLVRQQMSAIQSAHTGMLVASRPEATCHCAVAYLPSPYLTSALRILTADAIVADLIDDVPAQVDDPQRRQLLRDSYAEILPMCDWACATSQHVAETFQRYATTSIEVIRNGVHVPDETERSPEANTVGYVGMLNQTMNVGLMEAVVSKLPNVTFKLAGPIHTDLRPELATLRRAPNVEFLGPILQSDVPAFMQECAALISFKRVGNVTAGNDSMKIYEYLASGRPVVSTPVSPADRLEDVVFVADTADSFVQSIQRALQDDTAAAQEARVRVARANEWDTRIDTFVDRVRTCSSLSASSS